MSRISIDWSYATASYITLTPIVVRSSRKTMTGEYHSSGQLAAWMVRSCGGVMGTVPGMDLRLTLLGEVPAGQTRTYRVALRMAGP
ncbi:MAG: hypothetical protein ACK48N_11395, partial [Planctomyces sp.]